MKIKTATKTESSIPPYQLRSKPANQDQLQEDT